ncbi:MAG: aminotransferase class V-fold PLP-dependent enzyme, partial [Oscillospiraceae bacterium]|nr:aminotransferase class V-fold PLP-dependent enzyme [Oscillospiraceae bacterium]
MARVYNFSAGPSVLPLPVLERAAKEMTDYRCSGMSVMEMSHRSSVYQGIIDESIALLRRIMKIPDSQEILYMQGGATLQFAAVPMNLIGSTGKADYAVTGEFAGKAFKEAKKFGEVRAAVDMESESFSRIPRQEELDRDPGAAYFHYCANN